MSDRHRWWRSVSLAVATLLTTGLCGEALAVSFCNTTQVKFSNYTVTDDWETTNNGAPCFDMRNGADLNLNGHTITCTDASCAAAVTCDDDGSLVRSTVSDGTHVDISGPFSIGVENCSNVEELLTDGPATAVSSTRADHINNNVFNNCSNACIVVTMTSNTDRISDNLINPNGGDGISIVGKSSSTGPKVDHNLIRQFDIGISNADTTYIRFEDNILVEGSGTNDPFSVTATNKSFTNNFCEADAHCTTQYGSLTPPVGTILY